MASVFAAHGDLLSNDTDGCSVSNMRLAGFVDQKFSALCKKPTEFFEGNSIRKKGGSASLGVLDHQLYRRPAIEFINVEPIGHPARSGKPSA